MTRFFVGSTKGSMLNIRIGHPGTWRMWMRWWEPIDRILENAATCDMRGDWDQHLYEFAEHVDLGLPPRPQWPAWDPAENQDVRNAKQQVYYEADCKWRDENLPVIRAAYKAYDGDDENWKLTQETQLLYVLEDKRQDDCYEAVLDSIQEHGFLRCLTVKRDPTTKYGYESGDGHHRLAAAIDLGYTHVPYQWTPSIIAHDSGEWESGDPIFRRNTLRNFQ